MDFNKHSTFVGQHAFLSASKYHWINYDEQKLLDTWSSFRAAERGTELHDIACKLIKNRIKLPRSTKTLNMYVNDAIGYKLHPEVVLLYSDNCFGTADAIGFTGNFLRIHDLKTGGTPAHMEQLLVYAALFCLEYKIKPGDIQMELRIYQNDDILIANPTAEDILPIMDKVIRFDKIIREIKEKEEE